MITKEKLDAYIKMQDEVNDAAMQLLKWYYENIDDVYDYTFFIFKMIEDNFILYEREMVWCGEKDIYTHELEIELLYDKNKRKQMVLEKIKKQKKAQRRKKKEKEIKLKKREEKEIKEYKRLKTKYEDKL